jgi:Ca2+-binding RTX toxin-like protein
LQLERLELRTLLAVTSQVLNGSLLVVGNADDAIAINCSGGNVRINGQAPGTGAASCASLRSIVVRGGPGANAIDLSAVSRSSFASALEGQIRLRGGPGDDVIVGSAYGDVLGGGAGDDTLTGGPGSDSLRGHDDIDLLLETVSGAVTLSDSVLTSSTGSDSVLGIEEASLTGSNAADQIRAIGFPGVVTLVGRGGNDLLAGGGQEDSLDGGDGNDTLSGRGGDDTIAGGAGNDSLAAGGGFDLLFESANVNFSLRDNQLIGRGTDTLVGPFESASLVGGNADNLLDASLFTGDVTLDGGDGDDTLMGGAADDVLLGGKGIDQVAATADADFTLSDFELLSSSLLGTDSLAEIERARLTGGPSANRFEAIDFSGNVTLDGADGDDTFIAAAGNDSIVGGAGTDLLIASSESGFTLDASSLRTPDATGSDRFTGLEQAELTGGDGPDLLDAAAFPGSVTLDGGFGDDTLHGAAGDDLLIGGDDNDRIVAIGNSDFTVSDTTLVSPLSGTDTLQDIEVASLSGGPGANRLDAAAFSGNATLEGFGGNDTLLPGAGEDSVSGGTGMDLLVASGDDDFFLTSTTLEPFRQFGPDLIGSIEQASLTGGASANVLDAFEFSGAVTLDGGDGDDTLQGTASSDMLVGGAGDDLLVAEANARFTLTNTSLTTGAIVDTLSDIELASLTGGVGGHLMNALDFDGPVTLDGGGGNDTLVGGPQDDSLVGGEGIDRVLHSGDQDFTLDDSLLVGSDSGGLDALDGIEQASLTGGAAANRLDAAGFSGSVTLDGGGGNDTLLAATGNDSLIGGPGIDRVVAAADDTFIVSDDRLTSSLVGIDVLVEIEQVSVTGGEGDNLLTATEFSGLVILDGGDGNDTLAGGLGDDVIRGGAGVDRIVYTADVSYILSDLQLISSLGFGTDALESVEEASLTGGNSANLLDAQDFSGPVTLDGRGGPDTLIGGRESDSLVGGGGVDQLRAEADTNFTLDASLLESFRLGADTISSIDEVSLVGGSGGNVLDASQFAGTVTLEGGAGNDSLIGGVGPNSLLGGAGDDTLLGDAGDDILLGGDGDDELADTDGNDVLDGQAGCDTVNGLADEGC